MIGPGKAFDTDRFFVVSSNLLGGCRGTTGPSSTNPATGRPYGSDFPVITVADMVRAERALLTSSASRGWPPSPAARWGACRRSSGRCSYGDQVDAIIPIASTHALHPQGVAWNAIARSAITADPDWQGGHYYGTGRAPTAGMGVARMVGHITYLSAASLDDKFGRRLQFADDIRYRLTEPEFEVESYLRHQADSFVKRFDANTYLYTSRALTYFDLARQYGGGRLARRARATCRRERCSSRSARTGSIRRRAPRSWRPRSARAGKDVELHVIEAPYGHDCFLLEEARQTPMIQRFLAERDGSPFSFRGPCRDGLPSRRSLMEESSASDSTPVRCTPGSGPIRTPAPARCRSTRRRATCSRIRSRRRRTSTCRSTATPTRAS